MTKISVKTMLGILLVAFTLLLLLGKYYQTAEAKTLFDETKHDIENQIDCTMGTCPNNETKIIVPGGCVCSLANTSSGDWTTKIYNTYPQKGNGKEILFPFLDDGNITIADKYLQGWSYIDRYEPIQSEYSDLWDDPVDERYWGFIVYSLRPTRHLLYAGRITHDERYNQKIMEIVETFIDEDLEKNQSWENNHAVAFRTMVLINIWYKLREEKALTPNLSKKILSALQIHGEFLMDEKHYEPGYNHGINEAGALLLLANNFPEMPGSEKMLNLSKERIRTGLSNIIDEDGLLIENAPYYHAYALQKYWDINVYIKNQNINISDDFDKRIGEMISYCTYVLQPNLDTPLLGASMKRKIHLSDEFKEMSKTREDLVYVLTQGKQGVGPTQLNIAYNSSGTTIMRSGWGNGEVSYQNETQLIFDLGAYRTRHSHMDALSFNLYSNGETLITDSGLYTYADNDFGRYFQGTAAHNTIMVDGKNQPPGSPIPSKLNEGEGYVSQSGEHNLYLGVNHQRSITMIGHDLVLVVDQLSSEEPHTYSQLFHLSPEQTLKTDGLDVISLDNQSRKTLTIHQLITENLTLNWTIGQQAPIKGWCAYQYETKMPCYYVSYDYTGKNATFLTLLEVGEKETSAKLIGNTIYVEGEKNNYSISISIPQTQTKAKTKAEDTEITEHIHTRSMCNGTNATMFIRYDSEMALKKIKINNDEYYPLNKTIFTEIPCDNSEIYRIYEQEDFLPIFGYHNVLSDENANATLESEITVSDFESQVEYATNVMGCRWYTLGEIIYEYILKEKKLPPHACVMNFDDGRINNYRLALPILKKYNVKATFYVIIGLLDLPEKYLTNEQVTELYVSGNEIGSHTIKSAGLVTEQLNYSQLVYQINTSKNILEDRGYNIKTFAYPHGEWNNEITQVVKQSGYLAGRDISKPNNWRDRRTIAISANGTEFLWHMYYHKPERDNLTTLEHALGYNTWWQFEEGINIDQIKNENAPVKAFRQEQAPTETSYGYVSISLGDKTTNRFIASKNATYTIELFVRSGGTFKPYVDNAPYLILNDSPSCINGFCSFFFEAYLSEGAHNLTIEAYNGQTYLDKFRVFRTLTKQEYYTTTLYLENNTVEPEEPIKQIEIEIVTTKKKQEEGLIEQLLNKLKNG
jgi:peptidoglycan/xylan/chitin deacetylase (PgdA/CDA1 family)